MGCIGPITEYKRTERSEQTTAASTARNRSVLPLTADIPQVWHERAGGCCSLGVGETTLGSHLSGDLGDGVEGCRAVELGPTPTIGDVFMRRNNLGIVLEQSGLMGAAPRHWILR
jgi:hypothetical protein